MTSQPLFDPSAGHSAAELLSPAYPERAARGTVPKLRAWQSEALAQYFETMPKDFLAAATPGAGKTTFALRLASEMLHRHRISRIIVVAPTEHLKTQWAEAAARASIRLDPYFKNADKRFGRHYQGIVVTYAQVAMKPELHRELVEEQDTLVILDEVHHGGDALSWGDGLREAYQLARHRLMLSGTPFRSDTAPIPFVSYAPDDKGIRTSITDYSYGYSRALADGVVRPVLFMVYNGNMRWRTKVGEEMSARLGEGNTKDITSQAWRTALDPQGDWIPAVLRAADRRLTEVRGTIPDAGGLVIATDQEVARAYATILEEITGESVTVVLSDEKEASERIEQFAAGGPAAAAGGPASRWMVAVRMVSEGVDIPRLAVGVYATSASTPLFFAQAIGRFVRARRHGETASIFLPNVPSLMALASSMEVERDHALDRDTGDDEQGLDDGLIESANRTESASETMVDEFEWTALGSDATFDRVVFEGTEFGQEVPVASDEELDFIGIPGLLEPDQIQDLLRHRQRRQSKHASDRRRNEPAAEGAASEVPAPLHRTLKEQRKLLNQLVSLWASSTNRPHGMIHAELRSACGGPAVAQASVTQLQARIVMVRAWMKS